MKRREFITLVGGAAAAWPLSARAQQPMARVGLLFQGYASAAVKIVEYVMAGLREQGYVDGKNLAVEFRYAEGNYDRLPALATELVRRQVAVIIAPGGTPSALAAKAATQTIPIVITTGVDPVELALVASLARPGGNITGVAVLNVDMIAKRLELLHKLVSATQSVALLVNPANNPVTKAEVRGSQVAAGALGIDLLVLKASNQGEIEAAFSLLVHQQPGALIVGSDTLFFSLRDYVVRLAAQHRMPTMYRAREFTTEGGLVSYGPSLPDVFRLVGVYAGRILNGEKPADLPVQQQTKFELVINLKTARALGLEIPPTLLALADEVIE